MMNCEQVQDRFSELREGALSEGLAFRLRRHLDTCAGCREMYDRFGRVWQALDQFEEAPVPENLEYYIRARVTTDALYSARGAKGAWVRWLRNVVAVGAVTAIAVIMYLNVAPPGWVLGGLAGGTTQDPPQVEPQTLAWKEKGPSIEIKAHRKTLVKVEQILPTGECQEMDSFEVPRGTTVRVPLSMVERAGAPVALQVTTVSGETATTAIYVLPFGEPVPANSVTDEAVSALLTTAARYDVPLVIHGTAPTGQLHIDCRALSAVEALASAKGLENWKVVTHADRIELERRD